MSDHTHIEWTDATWQPITGCSVVSPGCTNCYAMQLAGTRLKHHDSRAGLTREVNGNHIWNGQVRLNEQWLTQPLKWTRPRRIFVCAHGDLFHEAVPDEWIDRVFAVMAICDRHTFQVLTKRSARMRAYLNDPNLPARVAGAGGRMMADGDTWLSVLGTQQWPLWNVWLGVSAEDQSRYDDRREDLESTPAAVRFLSIEPMLDGIDLDLGPHDCKRCDATGSIEAWGGEPGGQQCPDCKGAGAVYRKIDWVIVGGESGRKARPMHPDWARSIRDQCTNAGVPFFFKQWGEWGEPTDSLGRLDWPYHPDHDRTHWFDSRTCVRPAEHNWTERYTLGGGAWPPPPFDMFKTPEYLDQVARCPQSSCRAKGRCLGNEARAAVTWRGKKRAGRLLDGREWNDMPGPARAETSA
jgi:protein gp37